MLTRVGAAEIRAMVEPSVPGLTVFSAPKPFVDSHISTIQHNAIRSWLRLGPQVEVLLVGDETGIAKAARDLGVRHLEEVERNLAGTPLISAIFAAATRAAAHPVLVYSNADILLLDDFLPAVQRIAQRFPRFLIVGQRWDLDLTTPLQFVNGWSAGLRKRLAAEARRHPPAGSDYFVFPHGLFDILPPFALGRAGWDNWMIFEARRRGVPIVDASGSITAVHQDHDYGHLEGGAPHHRLPESLENVRLGRGPETIFTLADSTWRLSDQQISRVRWPGGSIWRWAEAELIVRLGPGPTLRVLRLLFSPRQALRRLGREVLRRIRAPKEAA